jgi:hypothetical protein
MTKYESPKENLNLDMIKYEFEYDDERKIYICRQRNKKNILKKSTLSILKIR